MGLRKWASEHQSIVFSVVFTTVVMGGGALWLSLRTKHLNENGPGEVLDAFVEGSPAPSSSNVLVLVESIRHPDEVSDEYNYRLSRLDLKTGAVLSRTVLEGRDRIRCQAASTSIPRMWCMYGGRLELRELPSFAVVTDDVRLAATSPDLRAGLMGMGSMTTIDLESSTLDAQTKDGFFVSISAKDLSVRKIESIKATSDTRMRLGQSINSTCMSGEISGSRFTLDTSKGPRATFWKEIMPWKLPRTTEADAGAPQALPNKPMKGQLGDQTFLGAHFLCQHSQLLRLEGNPSTTGALVIKHETSLDQNEKKLVLTAIDTEQGRVLWESPPQPIVGSISHAFRTDTTIGIVMSTEKGYVLGIDSATGRVSFRYDGSRR